MPISERAIREFNGRPTDIPRITDSPRTLKTASADAEVEAMAGCACCTLRSDDGPRTHGRAA